MAYDLILGKTKRDWSCGSLLLPQKQQDQILRKIDDVRYDVRHGANLVKVGLLALSASIGLVALTSAFRTASDNKRYLRR